jgi:acyl-CoA synthetase (AMP-forming)/AMP-acid ligase II
MITIPEMLARNARMYPEDVALVESRPSRGYRREVTWKAFDDDANRVANMLVDIGVKKGDRVLHWMLNSIDWLTVYFGILRTGAWAVPLNFRFTAQDFQYCADISDAKVVIVGEEFVDRVDSLKGSLPKVSKFVATASGLPDYMAEYHALVHEYPATPPGIQLQEADSCSLYFTSGTTGAPKPILLTHNNLKCAAITENAHHRQTKDDNFILIPPLYHTGSKMHWFGSLIVGGKATLLNEIGPRHILETVDRERGTIVWLLVPWAHDILVALENGDLTKDDYDLSCWRLMHIGAQPVPPALIRSWKSVFPEMQYDTNYGLTESTGPGCVHLGIDNERKVGAIGKPGFNWEARVVDDRGEVVGIGQVGELVVRGDGVMREYFSNPEKTAETLREGWLYTGDMASVDDEGFIFLVDRKKDVIITGGENIYPVEVEDALHGHPGVYDVAVIGIPDERLGEVAIAVVALKPGDKSSEADLLEFCKTDLAKHKVPRRIVFAEVPRNLTGKIEKPRLRERYAKLE